MSGRINDRTLHALPEPTQFKPVDPKDTKEVKDVPGWKKDFDPNVRLER